MLARSLQASVSITTRSRTHSRYLSQMATTQLGLQNKDRQHLFKHSERLETGRALVQDVWSIFKYAGSITSRCMRLTLLQCSKLTGRLYQSWARSQNKP